ncbi:MAG TPA: hypothetical protein VKB35_02210 [Ktedonobacteraceae bacterium]|nr:hypothetical protein [Ktedonobacteraceae bacterium]
MAGVQSRPLQSGKEHFRSSHEQGSNTHKGGEQKALYMDIHRQVEGLTEEAVAGAHARDLDVQEK